MMLPDLPQRSEIYRRMQAATEQMRLPFRNRVWRGQTGNWLGHGSGSSIDFQDHRPYLPGDDPRYIDWLAYARTGHYTLKLYREEVRPLVDLVLDVSASMFLNEAKTSRTFELFYFCMESARRSGAALHCFTAEGATIKQRSVEEALVTDDFLHAQESGAPHLRAVPWRQGSLRVFISDLLFPGAPAEIIKPLTIGNGRGLIFVPFSAAEAQPDWAGNVELTDCETQGARVQRVTADLLARYRLTYTRHFGLWREQARKHAAAFARVSAEGDLRSALHAEALPTGAVEFA